MTHSRFAAIAATLMFVVAACSAGKPARSPDPSPATVVPANPSSRPPALASDINELLIVRRLNPDPRDGYAVIAGGTGETLFSVPDGATSAGFRRIATAATEGATTAVRFLAGEGGELREEQRLDGSWQLPTIGVANRPVGISADGGTIILEQAASSGDKTSFAVVESEAEKPRVLTFRGDMSFDALSADGAWLYVIDHRPGGIYQVRRADTATGALDPGVIVDKRNPEEVMSGTAITQLVVGDWVYTLYLGPEGPFVHALNTAKGAAFCIDLPPADAPTSDEIAAAWALAASGDDRRLYAVNSALGEVNELSLERFALSRTASLPTQSAGITLAKFENGTWSDAGSAAVSADDEVLYVAGEHGVTAVGAKTLARIGSLGGDRGFRSLAVGASGQVYAVDSGGALHRLGSAEQPIDVSLASSGFMVIEGVLTFGG